MFVIQGRCGYDSDKAYPRIPRQKLEYHNASRGSLVSPKTSMELRRIHALEITGSIVYMVRYDWPLCDVRCAAVWG